MEEEHSASARGWNLAVSTKFSVEVANFIRGKSVQKAKLDMENVIEQTTAVPFWRYTRDLAHKPGPIGPGRYPVKVAKAILLLLQSAELNAINKGLDGDALFVKSIIANKGSGVMRAGRHRGRSAKRTHIEVIVEEKEIKKKMKIKAGKKGDKK